MMVGMNLINASECIMSSPHYQPPFENRSPRIDRTLTVWLAGDANRAEGASKDRWCLQEAHLTGVRRSVTIVK